MPSLEMVLNSIRQYAEEHGLTPQQVSDYFSVGISAKSILAEPDRYVVGETGPEVFVPRHKTFARLLGKLIEDKLEAARKPGGILS